MKKIPEAAFASVIRAYMASPKYQGLAASTKVGYFTYLRLAELPEALGALSVNVIHPADVQMFLDRLADRPGAQDRAKVSLKAVEKWAIVRRLLPWQITIGTVIVPSDGGHTPWNETQIACAIQHARSDIARAVTLAYATGQRGSDIIRMTWGDIEAVDGRSGINVVQKKTGLKIWVPMTQELMTTLATWERGPYPLLLRGNGKPWDSRLQLSESWNRHRDSNPELKPCAGLVMHGLRAAAVVRLRRSGAPATMISDMIGMSVPMVERYSRYANQRASATAAVHFLDRGRTENEQTIRKSCGNQ